MTLGEMNKFLELCKELHIDVEFAKEQAKKRYPQVKHFAQLTTIQLDPLIRAMEEELKESITPYRLQNKTTKDHDNFPNEFRIWDKQAEKMWEGLTLLSAGSMMTKSSWEPTAEPDRFHIMQSTGRLDNVRETIYDYDFVKSYTGKIYIVQWNWEGCSWTCYDMETDERIDLGLLGKVTKVGNPYTDVKE